MPKYQIVNQNDANVYHEICAKSAKDAALKALDVLGWSLVIAERRQSPEERSRRHSMKTGKEKKR